VTDLLPQLVEDEVAVLDRNADRLTDLARTLAGATDREQLFREVGAYLKRAWGRPGEPGEFWEWVRQTLSSGTVRGKAVMLLRGVVAYAGSWLRLTEAARLLAETIGAPVPEWLASDTVRATRMREDAERLLEGLERPRPPIDQSRLEAGLKDAAEGRVKTPDEVRALLREPQGWAVPYHVETVDAVVAYLRTVEGLSADALDQLVAGYSAELAEQADHFLELEALAPESYLFR
jgi:predicted transcriptional regulator